MQPVAAFCVEEEREGEMAWRAIEDPPHLVSLGDDDFVVEDARGERPGTAGNGGSGGSRRRRRGPPRVYVNGHRVIGLALVRAGDFVLIVERDGLTAYRFGGRLPRREERCGEICDFTRRPIEGPAVRCSCGAVVGEGAAKQIGSCPRCRGSLAVEAPAVPQEEELK